MKSIRRGRIKRKYDGTAYYYWDIATKSEVCISRDTLYELGRTLPEKVKKIIHRIALFKVPMTPEEQRDVLTLCSISISIWKGSPRISIDGVSMEDYTNDFYICMVHLLEKWDPEKGPWPNYVRFVRLKAMSMLYSRVKATEKKMAEVRNFHHLNGETVKDVDYRGLQVLGLQGTGGRKVNTSMSMT